jgi:hypothetical protein
LKEEIIIAYGNEPEKSPDFARIVNVKKLESINCND